MRVFGNLMNRIQEVSGPITPVVGMGATILMFSDRYPATIMRVLSPKRIVIQEDDAKRIDSNGMSESQDYEYSPNPLAAEKEVTLRKDGRWILAGESIRQGTAVRIGERDKYHDFSF